MACDKMIFGKWRNLGTTNAAPWLAKESRSLDATWHFVSSCCSDSHFIIIAYSDPRDSPPLTQNMFTFIRSCILLQQNSKMFKLQQNAASSFLRVTLRTSGTPEVQWKTGKHFVSYTSPIVPVSNTGIAIWNNRKELSRAHSSVRMCIQNWTFMCMLN